jgi:signal transduction histidine kinase
MNSKPGTAFAVPAVVRPAGASTVPRLYRSVSGRRLGGVAAGLAGHLGVRVRWVRLAFIGLCFAGGMGILLYGAFWIVLRVPPGEQENSRRTAVAFVVALVFGGAVLLFNVRAMPLGWWFIPSVLALFGGLLLWRQASETERERWRRLSRTSLVAGAFDRVGALRLALGIVLVIAGCVLVLARAGLSAVGVGLSAVLVTLVGIALITGPWWQRLAAELSAERRERIRVEERAELAAGLHDSVLQTLALIQRSAHSPREVTRLARSQERELRSRLYGTGAPTGRFGAALAAAAADVEDDHAVTIDVVTVGDIELDARLDAVVAAAREAMVNAAKHAGVTTVSVYAEVTEAEVAVYVRDRGRGFRPDKIAADRQGIRGSIVGRLERHGGSASVKSEPGAGTEVTVRVRR